jgi:homoserine dehydrogenase
MVVRLAGIGFGNVGHALQKLLMEKADELERRYQLAFAFSGALTRTAGGWIAPAGVSAAQLSASGWPAGDIPAGAEPFRGNVQEFIAACPADIVLELTTLEPETGHPAIGHIRAALQAGRHVVTANKGPVAHAYPELLALATRQSVALRFESTVMDGTPIFNLVESSLPVTTISGFRGLLNSTSNFVLGRMAAGETLESALQAARHLGIAEAVPTYDLEGWDAAVKATIVANVLMDAHLRPADVKRIGLGSEAMRREHLALPPGRILKQVVDGVRDGDSVLVEVRLEALPSSDVLAHLAGMEAALVLHTDTMQDLVIIEGEGGPGQTAFGVLADLIAISTRSFVS